MMHDRGGMATRCYEYEYEYVHAGSRIGERGSAIESIPIKEDQGDRGEDSISDWRPALERLILDPSRSCMRYALKPDVPSRSAENSHRSRSPASALSHNAARKTRIERTWEERRGTLGETTDGLIWAALNGDYRAHIKMDDRQGGRARDAARTCKNTMEQCSRDYRGLRCSARRCKLLRRAEKIRSHLQRESIDSDGGERPSGAHASKRPCEAEEAVASRGSTHRGHGV